MMKTKTNLVLFLMIVSLFSSSCENEEIGRAPKSTTYTEKADLNELLTQIGDKDAQLVLLLQNNSISKLKTNSGTSDYYFDTEHIMALKNDKNETSYNIPVYLKSDLRANFLYSISIEISAKKIDAKLNILEIENDGTEKYSAVLFNNTKHRFISSTTMTNKMECYCVTTVSDFTCCAIHADNGCTHPRITVSCGCSGGDRGTDVGTGVDTNGIKTSWSGNSGTGYTYASTGNGIYIELMKKFKPDYSFSLLEKYTIINNVAFSQGLLEFLNTEGYTPVNKAFVISMIYAIEAQQITTNQQFNITLNNFKYSQKSPMNIDFGTISNNTPEGAKFNEVYTALTQSPEFKKLFESIFKDNNRFNVKFEIADRVYEDNNPLKKEVHATTSPNDITKIITIKISKQILTAGSSMSQTKIENAKTILHECIHAYLFVKAGNPAAGVDFVKLLNSMYPTPNEQHDFMYNNMVPTMQKVLGEIRDFVTYPAGRSAVEELNMSGNSTTNIPWNWNEYYKFLSFSGLNEANCFIQDYPNPSSQLDFYIRYVTRGHSWLDKK